MSKKKILVIITGGTLASVESNNGLMPALSGQEIKVEFSKIFTQFHLEFQDLFALDSCNVNIDEWKAMAEAVDKEKDNFDGIVIIHGTDTMAYTSSMLSFMLRGINIPLVITGSQQSIMNFTSDATENCRLAFNMAASGVCGVYLAFDRKIIIGTRASKVRTTSYDAFESINFANFAVINSRGLYFNTPRWSRQAVDYELNTKISNDVFLLKMIPGMKPEVIDKIVDSGYRGIVIEAFGIGGLPFTISSRLEHNEKIRSGYTSVIVKSQCTYEISDLTVYETGRRILDAGVMQAYDMTTEATVCKMMWVLGQTSDPEKIKSYFARNLAEETNQEQI